MRLIFDSENQITAQSIAKAQMVFAYFQIFFFSKMSLYSTVTLSFVPINLGFFLRGLKILASFSGPGGSSSDFMINQVRSKPMGDCVIGFKIRFKTRLKFECSAVRSVEYDFE